MTTQKYLISGMTCSSCAARVKQSLEDVPGVELAQIDLENARGTLDITDQMPLAQLQDALSKSGHYTISKPIEVKKDTRRKPNLLSRLISRYF